MRSEPLVLALALALAGPAGAVDRAAERAAESARVAALPETDPPRRCMLLRNIQETRLIDQKTLLVRESASRWFRVTLPEPCPAIGDNRIAVWRVPTGQVCAGDPFDVVDPIGSISYGFCTLGAFQPVDNGRLASR
ncbi:MAG: DUF6491 family protein [Thermaurantiacus tibetensis]